MYGHPTPPPPKKKRYLMEPKNIYIHTQEQTKTKISQVLREEPWLELVCLLIGLGSLLSCLPPLSHTFSVLGIVLQGSSHVSFPVSRKYSSIFCLKSFIKNVDIVFVRNGQRPEKRQNTIRKHQKNIRKHKK